MLADRDMPGFMTYREISLIYAAIDDETAGKVIKAVCDYFWFRKKLIVLRIVQSTSMT